MDPHKFVKFIYEHKTSNLSNLAAKAGVSHNSISRWKTGTSPRLIDLEAVLEVLGFELVIAKRHRPDFEPERDAMLVSEVKAVLDDIAPVGDNEGIARDIVVKIGAAYEGQTCLDLTDEPVTQSRTIANYVRQINTLNERIAELELEQQYRNGTSKTFRSMKIGETRQFPAGDKSVNLARKLYNVAYSAGLRIKTHTVKKDGVVYVEATRVS